MTSPYQPPTSKVADVTRNTGRLSRALVALISGALLVPLFLFSAFRLIFPVEARGYGNAGFWIAVLLGSFLAALIAVWFKRMPIWLAAVLGPVVVLCIVALWVALTVFTGAA